MASIVLVQTLVHILYILAFCEIAPVVHLFFVPGLIRPTDCSALLSIMRFRISESFGPSTIASRTPSLSFCRVSSGSEIAERFFYLFEGCNWTSFAEPSAQLLVLSFQLVDFPLLLDYLSVE